MTRRTSPLNVVTSLLAAFAPGGTGAGGDTSEDGRYHRCTSHLVTILVDQFAGGSATLPSMLEWLRLKIEPTARRTSPWTRSRAG